LDQQKLTNSSLVHTGALQGRIQGGGGMPCHAPQDAEVAFWSTAIILIQ